MSEANFEQRHPSGFSQRPSPSIWKDCRKQLINDLGLGFYMHEEFAAPKTSTDPLDLFPSFDLDADASTIFTSVSGRFGGVQRIQTGAVANDAWALVVAPFCKFVLHSGQKVWFECRVELGAVSVAQSMFIGMAAEAALDRDVVSDTASDLDMQSLVGFALLSGDLDDFDAVFRTGSDAVTVMDDDVTQSTSLPAADRAALLADIPRKLGMRFDGKDQLGIFVDGLEISRTTMLASTFPDNVDMGFVAALKTDAAAVRTAAFSWVRMAYQESF